MNRKILIIKHGALGDVVRTSYFVDPIKRKWSASEVYWKTEKNSAEIINDIPGIYQVVTDWVELLNINFDIVYSLDDEIDTLNWVSKLSFIELVGAYIAEQNKVSYTENSASWFDMGLRSKFGKKIADRLKLENKKGHAEIFKSIFQVNEVTPQFYFSGEYYLLKERLKREDFFKIGINPYAGGRWPSKELRTKELQNLIEILLNKTPNTTRIYLFGGGGDFERNYLAVEKFNADRIVVLDTNKSIQMLAAYIGAMNFCISSDSLAMHLSIAQGIKTLAFFCPTSASEIDDFGVVNKLISTDSDYCSYSANADNSSITADRIFDAIKDSININKAF